MNRSAFLKTCLSGVCGCGFLGLQGSALRLDGGQAGQDATTPPDLETLKWQVEGGRVRFAKLIAILGEHVDAATRSKILNSLGRECAHDYDAVFAKYKGDLDGFLAKIKSGWAERAEYDKEKGVLRIFCKPAPCACPLVKAGLTPEVFCDCTLGWQEAAYSAVTGKRTFAEIEESVLRGGSRCVFRITFLG